MLPWFNFQFVHNLLHVGNLFGQASRFLLLGKRSYSAFENERSVLRLEVDALIIEVLVGLD